MAEPRSQGGGARRAENRLQRAKQHDRRSGKPLTALDEQAKRQEAELAKMEKLRALRLAKEAADAEAARRAALEKASTARTAPRSKVPQPLMAKPKTELV